MRPWAPVSAALAPVALIGAWTLAAARQPNGFDSIHDTISALAAAGATDPWVMTTGLAVLGTCHVATAAGLTELGPWARGIYGVGGVATVLVAVFAQPSAGHAPAATTAFAALALWPAASRWHPRAGRTASAVLLALLGAFALSLGTDTLVGLSERVVAAAEALVPLGFVLAARRRSVVAAT